MMPNGESAIMPATKAERARIVFILDWRIVLGSENIKGGKLYQRCPDSEGEKLLKIVLEAVKIDKS